MKAHWNRVSRKASFANTFRKGLASVLFFSLSSPAVGSKAPQESAPLTISVFNEAGVPGDVLIQAEVEASGIFRQSGIEVQWLNCGVLAGDEEESATCRVAVFPAHLHLRIVRRAAGLKGETVGISFQAEGGTGCYADLFYDPMEELHRSYGTNLATLLGHAAAHAIGHLLLGTNSHAVAGIMQARWTADQLIDTGIRRLSFLDNESHRMRERLLSRRQLRITRHEVLNEVLNAKPTLTVSTNAYVVFGATAQQEAILRAQIQIIHAEVLPLRVIFVPHWKYVVNTKTYRLHVPAGYTSTMFTHLPSRTVFIDADRYVSDDSLGYWMAHELGHLATNSVREADAERAASEYRKRLRTWRYELARDSFSHPFPLYMNESD